MSYQLGIDLGTTYTAAAVCQADERHPAGADVVTLGARSATVASVMYLADDGSVLVGEAAERRALTDPDRVVREFKRRIGDQIPLMVGGRPYQAHELGARMVRWVVDLVSERQGGPPRRIAVTHPASWGAHKKDLLGRALRDVGLSVTFLAEPQAAAVSYASAERVEVGSTVAVYDLGGGTFDAAVVRKSASGGFELLGRPEGIDRLGGVDFDEAVFGHVRDSLGAALDTLDPEDPDVLSAVARLRRECVEAKEALSSDTEATIPVLLPELRTQTRITRGELESMIRPALEETVGALRRAVGSAGLSPADLSAVLLVGGSSRIPLVSELVSDELGRPVAVDADPKTAIAMGAALAISPQPRPAPARPPSVPAGSPARQRPGPPSATGLGTPGVGAPGLGAAAYQSRSAPPRPPVDEPPPRPPVGDEPPPRPDAGITPAAFAPSRRADSYGGAPKRRQTGLLISLGGVLAVAAILAVVFLWPKQQNANSAGNGTDLTPPTTTEPTTEQKAPVGGGTRRTPIRTTPRTTTPPTTRIAPTTPPTTEPTTPPTEPTGPTGPTGPTRSNTNPGGGGTNSGGAPGTGGTGTGTGGGDRTGSGVGTGSTGGTASGPSGADQPGGGSPVSNQGVARSPQVNGGDSPASVTAPEPWPDDSSPGAGAAPSNLQRPWAGGTGELTAPEST